MSWPFSDMPPTVPATAVRKSASVTLTIAVRLVEREDIGVLEWI